MSINKILLHGNLTADPKSGTTTNGSWLNFRMAVSGFGPNAQPQYFNVAVFREQADQVGPFLYQGREVIVEGRVEQSTYPHASLVNEDGTPFQVPSMSVIAIPGGVQLCGKNERSNGAAPQGGAPG